MRMRRGPLGNVHRLKHKSRRGHEAHPTLALHLRPQSSEMRRGEYEESNSKKSPTSPRLRQLALRADLETAFGASQREYRFSGDPAQVIGAAWADPTDLSPLPPPTSKPPPGRYKHRDGNEGRCGPGESRVILIAEPFNEPLKGPNRGGFVQP